MSATPSIKVTKSMLFRGVLRSWSNRYHFSGGTPADSAHWTTFSDAVVAAEAPVIPSGSSRIITATTGYAAGSDVPVFTKAYTTAGSLNPGTGIVMPGDVAALVRYSTTARTSKNHPVYLFNYYHSAVSVGTATPDTLLSAQATALGTYAGQWIAGFSDGTLTLKRAGPNGATATGSLVEPFLTHRDFPR